MTKTDQTVESAADRIDTFVREARERRELRPKTREAPPGGVPRAPSEPQRARAPKRRAGGRNPWLVLGAALVGGYALAKLIDWRGHAHPRL